jgi:hypothetical protein
MQIEIALSTTEAEYIALSLLAQELIPMRGLLHELSETTKSIDGSTIVHLTIFEENKGCVELATAPRMRPWTRHVALKYHHFRSHVENGNLFIGLTPSINWLISLQSLLLHLLLFLFDNLS